MDQKFNPHNQEGYIALISAIIISLILLGLTFSISSAGYFARFSGLDAEQKRISKGLADSCVNVALLKVAQNPIYVGNEDIPVGSNQCHIDGVTYNPVSGYDANNQKVATIKTWAQFKGAFSNMQTSATVQDPTFSPPSKITVKSYVYGTGAAQPSHFAPYKVGSTTVSLDVSTVFSPGTYNISEATDNSHYTTTYSGDCDSSGNLTLGASNDSKTCTIINTLKPSTAKLTITIVSDGSLPSSITLNPGSISEPVVASQQINITDFSHTQVVTAPAIVGYNPPSFSTDCSANFMAGDNKVCAISYTKNAPSVACADTVTMLDRTGSLFNNPQDPVNEGKAAKSLLDLYSTVSPHPKVGIGSMGGLYPNGTSQAWVPDGSHSTPTGTLTSLYGASTTIASLGPNLPTGTTTPSNWLSPKNAFLDDSLFATSTTAGQQQVYSNFGFNPATVPGGSTVTGIEVMVDGKASSVPKTMISNIIPTTTAGVGNYTSTSWSTNSGSTVVNNKINAVNDGSDATYIKATTNVVQTFKIDTSAMSGLPNLTINSVTITVRAKNAGGSPTMSIRTEKGAGAANVLDTAVSGLTGSFGNFNTATFTKDPFTNANWTLAELSSWGFGVNKTNALGTLQVSEIYATVNYTYVPAPSAAVGVDLSWNNGAAGSWSGSQAINFVGGENAYPTATTTGSWGAHVWAAGDFADGKLILRLTNNSPAGMTAMVNYVTVQVDYSLPSNGLYKTIDTMMSSSSSGAGSYIAADINAGNGELNSGRHSAGLQKVLILISDGVPSDSAATVSSAANAAKSGAASSTIFTIHFGDSSGTSFLSSLASTDNTVASIASSNGAVRSGGIVTITTTVAHHLYVGQTVEITGVAAGAFNNAAYNYFTVASVPSPTTFTYNQAGSNTSSGSGSVKFPHSFDSPSSDQMKDVFSAIGSISCPQSLSTYTPPPISPILVVVNHVNNDSGTANNAASDFTMSVGPAGLSPVPASFPGSESGTVVTFAPGSGLSYSVSQSGPSGYTSGQSADCTSSISNGQTKTCVVINNANPPAPTGGQQPTSGVGVTSWQESP